MSPRTRYDDWQPDTDLDTDDPDAAWESDDGDWSRAPRPRREPRSPKRNRRAGRSQEAGDAGELDDSYDEVAEARERRERERRKADISEPFKCRNCRAFIGMPPTGGQQRNHCPMCLYSLHVDGRTPGDRASDCRSLMEPIGVFYRRNMEQVVVHRCLGCGFMRYNRIAADDHPILLSELPIVDPPQVDESG